MLEEIIRRPHVRRRLERNLLAELIVDYVGHLTRRGHTQNVIRAYVAAVEHFGCWLQRTDRTAAALDATTVKEFLTRHLPRCRCRERRPCGLIGVRAALHQLLRVSPCFPGTIVAVAPVDVAVSAFDLHLRQTCGLAPASRLYFTRYVRELLRERFASGPVRPETLTLGDISAFVTARAVHLVPGSALTVVTAMRSFLRYLQLCGLATANWVDGLPRVAHWRLAAIPDVLSDGQLRDLLAAFNRTTASGRRDYAIAVCFTHLALRAGEVARVALDDIEWRSRVLTVAAGKGRHADQLPLPSHVVAALADYLRHGRPTTNSRAVFVHHRAPLGTPLGVSGVRCAIRQAYARAGFDPRLTGTHVLRHTAATHLLRAGASMKQIADVLRHRSLDTSAIYAKVDREALSGVALPWPEVRP